MHKNFIIRVPVLANFHPNIEFPSHHFASRVKDFRFNDRLEKGDSIGTSKHIY